MKSNKKIPVAKNHLLKVFGVILDGLDVEKRGNVIPENFANLKLQNNKFLFNADDEKCMEEIHELGEMMHSDLIGGARKVLDYLTKVVIPERNNLLESEGSETYSLIIFMSPLLAEHRKREEAVLALLEDKGPLTDTTSCPRCGEAKVHRILKQTRSADEGISALFTCPNCLLPWAEN